MKSSWISFQISLSFERLSHMRCWVCRCLAVVAHWPVVVRLQQEEERVHATITIKISVLKAFIDVFSRRWYFNNFTVCSRCTAFHSLERTLNLTLIAIWIFMRFTSVIESRYIRGENYYHHRSSEHVPMSWASAKLHFYCIFSLSSTLFLKPKTALGGKTTHGSVMRWWRGETAIVCKKCKFFPPQPTTSHIARAAKSSFQVNWINIKRKTLHRSAPQWSALRALADCSTSHSNSAERWNSIFIFAKSWNSGFRSII